MEKKLQRDENNKMIGGVAAGLAEYFGVDVVWFRLVFFLALFGGGAGFFGYIILWIALPKKRFNPYSGFGQTVDYTVNEPRNPYAEAPRADFDIDPMLKKKRDDNGRLIAGMILIVIGGYFLIYQMGLIPHWFSFTKLWPLALIIPGIIMLTQSSVKHFDEKRAADIPVEKETPAPEQTTTDQSQNI